MAYPSAMAHYQIEPAYKEPLASLSQYINKQALSTILVDSQLHAQSRFSALSLLEPLLAFLLLRLALPLGGFPTLSKLR